MSAGVASALVTLAGVSSMAYQLTSLMLYKAAEVGANAAITLLQRRGSLALTDSSGSSGSVGEVQYILMELDIEAKFKSVQALLESIEQGRVGDVAPGQADFLAVSIANTREAMDAVSATLRRVQDAMDDHSQRWFNSYRALDVVQDLQLLKAQSRMFDKRLEVLVQCLTVPVRQAEGFQGIEAGLRSNSTSGSYNGGGAGAFMTGPELTGFASAARREALQFEKDEGSLMDQRIFGESYDFLGDAAPGTDRLKNMLMAKRALKDADLVGDETKASTSQRQPRRDRTIITPHQDSVAFEDPVFL